MGTIVLVRHGETEGQSSIRLNGATDVPLNDIGRQQMRLVGSALAGQTFDMVLVSPLARSRAAAELIVGIQGPPSTVVPAFTEIDFGAWEGLTHEEAAERDPDHHAAWNTQGAEFRFPDGESRQGFRDRVAAGVRAALCRTDKRILGVLHKGVIKIIVGELLGLPFERTSALPVDLGSIHRLEWLGTRWQLETANVVDHLA